MGGNGSGRWSMHQKKRTTEECWALDVADLPQGPRQHGSTSGVLRAVRIDGKRSVLRVRYALEPSDEAGPLVVLSYHLGRGTAEQKLIEHVPLLATRPNFGGTRFWFACPFSWEDGEPCGGRVGKLYLPPGEHHFGCRRCHSLTYRSSQESNCYDRVFALLAEYIPGATPEWLKRGFYRTRREARKRRRGGTRGLLKAFDREFG
jgi:hypothetical protein